MTSFKKIVLTALCAASAIATRAQMPGTLSLLGDNHVFYRLQVKQRFLLLPVEERQENARLCIIKNNEIVKELNCKLAVDKTDYTVPLDLNDYQGSDILIDITFPNNRRSTGAVKDFVVWKELKTSDSFDTTNREKYRPVYHHTPQWGWMNDPNGLFYKDGVWHLYFQYNPYGSQWENMTWGHSTSKDLVHWVHQGNAISPDALGTIFSGSAIVDKINTSGLGKGTVVAMYTSAGKSQTQSLAYSTDDGKTFTKYANNPVITAEVPDFRDPHMFWNEDIHAWNLILAAGQEMNIYSSKDLKNWTFESVFGLGYGNHDGVWECPDLMKLPVNGTGEEKWLLICNINPGGPFGGSATQYFVGSFDGHKFTCESKPDVTKWMDYGKDHYATVTFDNAPDNRRVAIAWMSNWQYANQVPTMQYRSANSVPRDLGLFTDAGETYVSVVPSKELLALRGDKTNRLSAACELVVDIKSQSKPTVITLSNARDEQVVMTYNPKDCTFSMDRTQSGNTGFNDMFRAKTIAPTHGTIRQLRIFIDKCSIEAFDTAGKMAMTNLVFPTEPYGRLTVNGAAKTTLYELK
ncbi:DUF4980 domain-containing protein [Segatella maculosa]|uniref:DUF4980 domain-containing protein n=1 Tax=Segatella maculosa TaxID=439703 RepID=UPI0023F32AB3|nr:DUF4980 domain-containing protein [Segatella maculosa]